MRTAGMLLLIVGVSLCAASSARLTPDVAQKISVSARAENMAAISPDSPETAAANITNAATPVIQPNDRLSGWLSTHGALFSVGLLCVIAGAVISRKAIQKAANDQPTSGEQKNTIQIPSDFGHMLTDLTKKVDEILSANALVNYLSDDAAKDVKTRIEVMQIQFLEPMTDAPVRARIQLRYGLEGLAAIFSPLSAAERRINRAWCALVDRHWPEAHASLTGARAELIAASEALAALKPKTV